MGSRQLFFHKLFLSMGFSLVSWVLVKNYLVEITLINYIFVELIVLFSLKLFIFTSRKFLILPK